MAVDNKYELITSVLGVVNCLLNESKSFEEAKARLSHFSQEIQTLKDVDIALQSIESLRCLALVP